MHPSHTYTPTPHASTYNSSHTLHVSTYNSSHTCTYAHNIQTRIPLSLSHTQTDHHSRVNIELVQEPSQTKLTLLQTEVPEADLERTKQGWNRYIFESIKRTFGYGLHGL